MAKSSRILEAEGKKILTKASISMNKTLQSLAEKFIWGYET